AGALIQGVQERIPAHGAGRQGVGIGDRARADLVQRDDLDEPDRRAQLRPHPHPRLRPAPERDSHGPVADGAQGGERDEHGGRRGASVAAVTVEPLRRQLAYLAERSPFYRAKLGDLPTRITSTKDLRAIPYTTKDELRASQEREPPFGAYLCAPREQLV